LLGPRGGIEAHLHQLVVFTACRLTSIVATKLKPAPSVFAWWIKGHDAMSGSEKGRMDELQHTRRGTGHELHT
jgi:hypothetical protein